MLLKQQTKQNEKIKGETEGRKEEEKEKKNEIYKSFLDFTERVLMLLGDETKWRLIESRPRRQKSLLCQPR